MGFLRILGRKQGTISVEAPATTTPEKWVCVIGRLIPPFRSVHYNTAAGVVDLDFDPSVDSTSVVTAINRLVDVAIDVTGRFLGMDRDALEAARETLEAGLSAAPIDMRERGSEERLRELVERL